MKNPKLKLVQTKTTAFSPPPTLGKAGSTLWRSIMDEYKISDSGGRQILEQICAATDDLDDCTKAIERDGLVIKTPNGVKEHPLCRRQIAIRSFITRNVQRLGLSLEPTRPVGRPPLKAGPTFDFEDD